MYDNNQFPSVIFYVQIASSRINYIVQFTWVLLLYLDIVLLWSIKLQIRLSSRLWFYQVLKTADQKYSHEETFSKLSVQQRLQSLRGWNIIAQWYCYVWKWHGSSVKFSIMNIQYKQVRPCSNYAAHCMWSHMNCSNEH